MFHTGATPLQSTPAPYKGIPTLTATSYKPWSTLIRLHLIAKRAFASALQDPPPLEPPEPHVQWSACNARCLGTALKTMDAPHFTLCADMPDFRTLWNTLSQKYATPDRQATETYARQLETLALLPGESIPAYFMRIRVIALHLTSAGEPVPDHQLLRFALQGLPSSTYQRIKSTIAHTANVTFNDAETMLLRDSVFFSDVHDTTPMHEAIHTIQRNLPSSSNFRTQSRRPLPQALFCSLHGPGSHTTTQCRALALQQRPSADSYQPRGQFQNRRSRRSRGGRRNFFRPSQQPQASATFVEDAPDSFHDDYDDPSAVLPEPAVRSAVASSTQQFMCLSTLTVAPPQPYALVTQDPTSTQSDSDSWALDSGANLHLCQHYHWLLDPQPVNVQVRLAGKGHLLTATHLGKVKISLGDTKVLLGTVYYSAELAGNLLSVRELASKNVLSLFDVDHVLTMTRDGDTLAKIPYTNGRYCLNAPALETSDITLTPNVTHVAQQANQPKPQPAPSTTTSPVRQEDPTPSTTPPLQPASRSAAAKRQWELLHRRLGHLSEIKMKQLLRFGLLRGLHTKPATLQPCDICACAKAKRLPFSGRHGIQATRPLFGLSIDLLGPVSVTSTQGSRYALVIVDQYTRRYFVYGLQQKSEAPNYIASFILEKEVELGLPVASITTDNALEFTSRDFTHFLQRKGIRHFFIAPGTPTENALAERAVGVLTQTTRCLLLESSLPATFWEYAIQFATYVHNVTPCASLPQNSTPMIRWNGRLPTYRHHRTFGSIAYVHQGNVPGRFKFHPTARPGVFLGYASRRGGYLIWIPQTQKVIVSRNVFFDEEKRMDIPDGPLDNTDDTRFLPNQPQDSDSSSSDDELSDTSEGPPPPPTPPESPPPAPPESPTPSSDDQEPLATTSGESAEPVPMPPSPEQNARLRTLRSWDASRPVTT